MQRLWEGKAAVCPCLGAAGNRKRHIVGPTSGLEVTIGVLLALRCKSLDVFSAIVLVQEVTMLLKCYK